MNIPTITQAERDEVVRAMGQLRCGRPLGQLESIRRQLRELWDESLAGRLQFNLNAPVGIGCAGGRLRIAFMHPDMNRFYGPAWQMPLGAADENGTQQILLFVQEATDGRVHLFPLNPIYRESVNSIAANLDEMFPDAEVYDIHSYEQFGTRMSRRLLLSLGYFSQEEIEQRQKDALPIPPESLWVENSLRRPFALVGNAIASFRTVREGELGQKIEATLGRNRFRGLRIITTGTLPQGGFSSSTALTVATKNGMNALFEFELSDDRLIDLAAQAEYGTGVRAGSLDQVTEQKGEPQVGAIISSNPRERYPILGRFPVPTDRIAVLFPYSVPRDQQSHLWSGGFYAETAGSDSQEGVLTTTEIRRLTGKATEIVAICLGLPIDQDFFPMVQEELVTSGLLSRKKRMEVAALLAKLPLVVNKEILKEQIARRFDWYVQELGRVYNLPSDEAKPKVEQLFESLFWGWRNPVFPNQTGVPLRATVAYLFGEVAKNFYLIHHQDRWIEYVQLSQLGDRLYDIAPDRLPGRDELERGLPWERDFQGAALLDQWLRRLGATPVDFNRSLDDETLLSNEPPEFHRLVGSNFFRGLALIDFAEAMLIRAFGRESVAVRVNAAGHGDYFQVHLDRTKTSQEEVRSFLINAYYNRFDLAGISGKTTSDKFEPFIEIHPGGPAIGIRLSRFALIDELIKICLTK